MKVQIRRGVFETNSSSMHSLTMCVDEVFTDKGESVRYTPEELEKVMSHYVTDKGIFNGEYKEVIFNHPNDWYFGRYPFRIFTNFAEKFAYVYANRGNKEELLDILEKYCPYVKCVNWPTDYGTDDCSLNAWLNIWNISLEDFLLDKRYIVICDGDEYCFFNTLLNNGVIDITKLKNSKGELFSEIMARKIEQDDGYAYLDGSDI